MFYFLYNIKYIIAQKTLNDVDGTNAVILL